VEDGLVLPGEARALEVLLRAARAHGEGRVAERRERLAHGALHLLGELALLDALPRRLRVRRQREHLPGLGREHEALGHREARRGERAERGRLAADEGRVLGRERRELQDERHAIRVPMRTSVSMFSWVAFTRSSSTTILPGSAASTTV